MQAQDYATVAVAVMTIIGGFTAAIRWLVKHYLSELKPDGNGGHNLEGRLTRLETRVDQIYTLISKGEK